MQIKISAESDYKKLITYRTPLVFISYVAPKLIKKVERVLTNDLGNKKEETT